MKSVSVSPEDITGIQRSLRQSRLALAMLDSELSRAGLGASPKDKPENRPFSVDRFKDSLSQKED